MIVKTVNVDPNEAREMDVSHLELLFCTAPDTTRSFKNNTFLSIDDI